MDVGESMSLPFWFDESECLYYIPEHTLITLEEAYQQYGITSQVVMQCKAWWNTNIPMDHFLPILIPCDNKDAGVDVCLTNFIERLKQRSEGMLCPRPPELKVIPGIAVLSKEHEFIGFYITHPDTSAVIQYLEVQDNRLSGHLMHGEIIQRNPDHLYWNMTEGQYV
jgi:hypothetical protein